MKNSGSNTNSKEKIVILSKGEVSNLKRAEFPDGTSSVRLESEYFEKHKEFTSRDKDFYKKYSSDLTSIVDNFAFDVALVDATNGNNLTNSKTRAIENYTKLQEILKNPKSGDKEKAMVSDYLKLLNGKALDTIATKYQEEKSR